MKVTFSILLFFLFFAIHSQVKLENLTSVALSKIYLFPDDGPCNLFVSDISNDFSTQKITNCDELVMKLIKIQEKKKQWKSQTSSCLKRWIGMETIENRIIYQYNKLIDTLYFNYYENKTTLIDYKNEIDYYDENNELINVLFENKSFKNLILTNVERLFTDVFYYRENDSIDIEDLNINGKNYYNLNKEKLDSLVGGFSRHVEIERDAFDKIDKYKYYNSNKDSYNHYFFTNNYPISKLSVIPITDEENQYPDKKIFNINGITFNDSEEKLIQSFPISTHYIKEIKEFFKAENGDYSIDVKISDEKGNVMFLLNNGKIIKVEVDFYYPQN